MRYILQKYRSTESDRFMDIITTSLLKEFSEEYGLESLPEDKRFEHFSAFITVRGQYSETFAPEAIVVGSGGDLGIDAIAIVANGLLSCEQNFPPLNSKKIESYCAKLNQTMFDADQSETLFREAASIVDRLCPGGPDRDTIHTTAFSTQLIAACAQKQADAKSIESIGQHG
jgi:hypothetical protein